MAHSSKTMVGTGAPAISARLGLHDTVHLLVHRPGPGEVMYGATREGQSARPQSFVVCFRELQRARHVAQRLTVPLASREGWGEDPKGSKGSTPFLVAGALTDSDGRRRLIAPSDHLNAQGPRLLPPHSWRLVTPGLAEAPCDEEDAGFAARKQQGPGESRAALLPTPRLAAKPRHPGGAGEAAAPAPAAVGGWGTRAVEYGALVLSFPQEFNLGAVVVEGAPVVSGRRWAAWRVADVVVAAYDSRAFVQALQRGGRAPPDAV